MNFVPAARAARDELAGRARPISPAPGATGAPAGMPMSTTSTRPACSLPGLIHRPGLAAWNVAVARRVHRGAARPRRSPRRRRWARRRPRPARPAASIAAIAACAGSRGAPSKPVPSRRRRSRRRPRARSGANGSGAHRAARRGSRRRRPAAPPGRRASSTRTSRPASRRSRAATRPSPPLLPLPQTIATGPVGATCAHEPGEARARALHQLERRDAALLDRPAVGRAHRAPRRAAASSQSGQRHRATADQATAPAMPREWVSEIVDVAPRGSASAPCSADADARGLPGTTSMSCQLQASRRSALATASFAQNRAARCCAGRALPRRVGALAVGEQPLGQPGPALQRRAPAGRSPAGRGPTRIGAGRLLLDGDGLGQVARLVDVQAAAARDPVGQQLQRDDGEQRLQHPVGRAARRGPPRRARRSRRCPRWRRRSRARRGRGPPACWRRPCRARASRWRRTTTGVRSSSSAIGPCFISPAA